MVERQLCRDPCWRCGLVLVWLVPAQLITAQPIAADPFADEPVEFIELEVPAAAPEEASQKPFVENEPKKAKLGLGAALGALVRDAFGGIAQQDIAQQNQNEQFVKQFEQQYLKLIQQVYRTELHFIRTVCDPTKEEFQQISADGEVALKKAVRALALAQQNGGRLANSSKLSDPRQLIAARLNEVVQSNLPAERAGHYQAALDRREESIKRVVVLNIIAKLDKQLKLTGEQRGELQKVLASNWRNAWANTQMLLYSGGHYPQLPANKILPLLNESQKNAWHGVYNARNIHFGVNFGMVQGVEIAVERW